MSSNFPHTLPTLSTPTLTLRPLTEADIPTWFARATDAESATLAGDSIPASIAEGQHWLARHRQRFQEGTAIRWAIVPANTPGSIGTIGLTFPAPGARTAELGFVIARTHWNRGLGTAASRLVACYAFETLGLTELHAEALRRNLPSRRILEKLGFRHLRALPADPEDCDLYRLANPSPPAA